jgi:hypothetical protein
MEIGSQVRVARVLAANPGLLRAGMDLGELTAALRRAGASLRFEEMQALRAAAYEAQGLRLPAHSRESLDELVGNVWRDRARILQEADTIKARNVQEIQTAKAEGRQPRLRDPSSPVYNLYSGATEANPLTRQASEYLGEIADIARARPQGAVSNIQGMRGGITELAEAGRLSGGQVERSFFRFERAGADLSRVQERIYLNVNADRAPQVMEFVVRDIVDNPGKFPGIGMAKLAGPRSVSRRAESIVIYAEDAAAVERVMQRIRAYHGSNPDNFRATTPFMTNRILEGVSVGAEPLGSGGAVSFGQVRARAIYSALRQSTRPGETQEQFLQRVLDALRRAGVNPDAPHLNLPTGAGP